uniref:dUTP diphosphatase n=1 Tax=Marseillevirus sp. TaxID=2809551 RepID=A0AA96EM26_9VIRU|nr:deoxyuridine 5'-triphosphate nucleotidohydrolase [Marseillevirus sp.]WNL50182.1 deoxyuridine 5 triphosphate nucleotidohydrolase [Marseillevirus sp.]
MESVRIVSLSSHPLPKYETSGSSGMDLRATIEGPVILRPGQRYLVPTGIMIELPEHLEAQIRPRSGLAFKNGVTVLNSPGTVDSDFRSEVKVLLINLSNEEFTINDGDRIAQMVISPITRIRWELAGELNKTKRGEGGFGSTGV